MNKIVTVGKARQLYEIMKEKIAAGQYAEGEKLPSIRELAQSYGLSTNTVNTVVAMLANDGLVAIREGNGTFVKRGCSRARKIGVMLFGFRSGGHVEGEILRAIQQNLPQNYYLLVMDTPQDYGEFCQRLEQMLDNGVEGLIVQLPKKKPDARREAQIVRLLSGRIAVMVNRTLDTLEADMYSVNLGRGIEKAFEYLALSGKRDTAIVLHDDDKFRSEEILAYTRCCAEYGQVWRPERMIEYDENAAAVRESLSRVLPCADSLISSDFILTELEDFFSGLGRKIPEELSLIGINDLPHSGSFHPPLTSIAFPAERVGRHAIHKLVRRIEGECAEPYKRTNFEPELIIRKT